MIWAIGIGYLLGSIPFGLLLVRFVTGRDVRSIGSGNIGTTNVLRTGSRKLAAATLLLDAGKAAAAVWIGFAAFGFHAGLAAGAAALVGHCYPVWLKFRGGKGVATFFGALLASAPLVFGAAALTWLAVAWFTRYSSLAALLAAAAAPVAALALGRPWIALLALVLAGVIGWRHRENIARLRAGTESRIGGK